MMTFYAAAGSYQIRNEDGKDMPYIMRLGKLQPVSIPEFSIWSMLLWDVLTHDELRKKYFEKMEEVKLDPSGFEKALEMLVKRKLIIKGVGYTGADALYNMLYDTYVIPLRGVQGTRRLLNIAKLLKQGKVNFFEAVYLLQPDKGTEAEQRIMKLVTAIHSIRSWTGSRVTSAIVVIIHTVSSRMPPGGLRCSLPNGKKILRKGVMTMADEKRYFSVKDMFEQAVTRAKTDPRYEEYSKICELDYDLLCSTCKYDKLYRCEFDVVGEVTYGSSEGIYGDIFLYGNWSKERDDPFKSRARVYVLKTLKQDKESYLAVGMLVNLICYYANEFVATHLDRFD